VGEADKLVLHEDALKVLNVFPGRMPGQCALMSALCSLALERLGLQRGYVVAGSLYIGDKRVFEDEKFDSKKLLSESNLDWDGHAWVVYGDAGSPRILPKYIAKELGTGKGMLASRMAAMDTSGVPQYVSTQDQVDAGGIVKCRRTLRKIAGFESNGPATSVNPLFRKRCFLIGEQLS
jgi:hypothetical protein